MFGLLFILALMASILILILLAYFLFRIISGWRRYKGVGVAEIILTAIFTFPGIMGGGHFFVPVPLGVTIIIVPIATIMRWEWVWKWEHLIMFRKGDILESILIHAVWLAVLYVVFWLRYSRERKRKLAVEMYKH